MTSRRVTIRTPTVVLALFLLAVPTAFGVFPELLDLSAWLRAAVGGGWLVVAVLAAVSTQRHEARVEQLMEAQRVQRERLRQIARVYTLGSVLRPGTQDTPEQYHWTIYVYDETADLLLPVFPEHVTDHGDVRVFAPGKGGNRTGVSAASTCLGHW